jgi:1-acyl-sn-glycerol-3-phosphate acyltransferase
LVYYFKWFLVSIALPIGSFFGICTAIFRPLHPKNTIFYYKVVAPLMLWILGVKIRIENPERLPNDLTEPAVLMGNHQHNIDAFVFTQVFHWTHVMIGKKSIRYIPIFGQWFWLCGQILLDRNSKRAAHETMNQVEDYLGSKKFSLFIFPEGTRSHSNEMNSFKKGGFRVAVNLGRDIIPVVACSYLDNINMNNFWNSGEILLRVLPRISTKEYTLDNMGELMDKVRSVMEAERTKIKATLNQK